MHLTPALAKQSVGRSDTFIPNLQIQELVPRFVTHAGQPPAERSRLFGTNDLTPFFHRRLTVGLQSSIDVWSPASPVSSHTFPESGSQFGIPPFL